MSARASGAQRSLWDAAVGIAAGLLVFGAVPTVLVTFVGLPLPRHWTGRDLLSWHGLFDLLAIVSWCAWAGCAWPILRSAVVRAKAKDFDPAHRLSDRIGARIALGVLALSSFVGAGAGIGVGVVTSAAAASVPAFRQPVISESASARPPHPGPDSSRAADFPTTGPPGVLPDRDEAADEAADEATTWFVRAGDTLPLIAASRYDDPGAWPAIASVNLGRLMEDGARFVDPCALSPGWTLDLPALEGEPRRRAGHDAGVHTEVRSAGGTRLCGPVPPLPLLAVGSLVPMTELAGAGVSALVAGLLARRSRQLRRLRALLREEGSATSTPGTTDADLGVAIAPFEAAPLVEVVEAAARHLGDALAALEAPTGPVLWLRAGRDGVEARFADPVPDAVSGWRRASPSSWLLPASVDPGALVAKLGRGDPWCPVLVPLGDDERGTWLLPVLPGQCAAIIGPRSNELLLAMRAGVESWRWHEALVVTTDPDDAATAVGGSARLPTDAQPWPAVLFVGDPRQLRGFTRQRCAVLAPCRLDEADVTVVVDARGASIHPFGLTVRPPLLDVAWSDAVETIVEQGPRPARGAREPSPLLRAPSASATRRVTDRFGETVEIRPGPEPSPGQPSGRVGSDRSITPARGSAEVQLLAPVPCIVGLESALPPKRARRAVELVAYLAAHAPEPVTGDRLRTRVLGTADADAAAKTLFNTVGAARRALGLGPDGQALLPPASRTGHYRLSASVTLDATRAAALLRTGLEARDRDQAADLLRAGLELVQGEPLGGVLTGYSWWRAEGHERRIADAVVDGACALVRAALATGDVDLARWALERGRTVEPYCEALTRAAMRIAAASGDARRLHAEWQECRQQMDELDPGGTPSGRTEQLYALLRAQLAGDRAEGAVLA